MSELTCVVVVCLTSLVCPTARTKLFTGIVSDDVRWHLLGKRPVRRSGGVREDFECEGVSGVSGVSVFVVWRGVVVTILGLVRRFLCR